MAAPSLRAAAPILLGAAVMGSLSMGLRQSLGLLLPPLTRDIGLSVSQFTLALSVQNLAWAVVNRSPAPSWCASASAR
jgi:hypothetical protein